MHTYRLKLPGADPRNSEEFEGEDAHSALARARLHAGRMPAELWCDGRQVCTIVETASGFWRIAPVEELASPIRSTEKQDRHGGEGGAPAVLGKSSVRTSPVRTWGQTLFSMLF